MACDNVSTSTHIVGVEGCCSRLGVRSGVCCRLHSRPTMSGVTDVEIYKLVLGACHEHLATLKFIAYQNPSTHHEALLHLRFRYLRARGGRLDFSQCSCRVASPRNRQQVQSQCEYDTCVQQIRTCTHVLLGRVWLLPEDQYLCQRQRMVLGWRL